MNILSIFIVSIYVVNSLMYYKEWKRGPRSDFPYMAYVEFTPEESTNKIRCSAILIKQREGLTASVCVPATKEYHGKMCMDKKCIDINQTSVNVGKTTVKIFLMHNFQLGNTIQFAKLPDQSIKYRDIYKVRFKCKEVCTDDDNEPMFFRLKYFGSAEKKNASTLYTQLKYYPLGKHKCPNESGCALLCGDTIYGIKVKGHTCKKPLYQSLPGNLSHTSMLSNNSNKIMNILIRVIIMKCLLK